MYNVTCTLSGESTVGKVNSLTRELCKESGLFLCFDSQFVFEPMPSIPTFNGVIHTHCFNILSLCESDELQQCYWCRNECVTHLTEFCQPTSKCKDSKQRHLAGTSGKAASLTEQQLPELH